MGEVKNTVETQKDFTKKNQPKVVEKADSKFNSSFVEHKDEPAKVETKPDVKTESKVEAKVETKVEAKPVANPVKFTGKVIAVSPLSYVVQDKKGNGHLVTGKHNKKVGEVIF